MKFNAFVFSKLILLLLISVILFSNAQAQDSTSFWKKSVRITGDAAAYGELYSMSGRNNRRPPSTARLNIRPTITFFNLFSVPIDILISTEGSSARQNINQFGINPSWSWGTAHLGDFSLSYSPFTLSGITIRGAGLDIRPGIFRFSATAGLTKRAVEGGINNGSYQRFLFASKIGIGNEGGNHFNLIVLKAKDKVSSLQNNSQTITVISPNGGDEIPLNTVQTINWTSTNITGLVKIDISRDGGASFETLFKDQPNTGSVMWNVSGPETFQAIIRISSEDDSSISDVSDAPFTIAAGIGYSKGNIFPNIENTDAVTPKENLVIGLNGKTNMFGNIISLHLEAAGSAFTRDLRATPLDLSKVKIPGFAKSIFKPRISSSFDYAVNSGLNFHLRSFSAKLGYKYIGPGYTSLGLPYLLNDQQKLSALTSFRISKFNLNLNWYRINNNLLSQKRFTTVRNQYGASLSGLLTDFWNVSLMTSILDMGNNSNNDTTKLNFSNLVISANNSFSVKNSVLKNINIGYTFQGADNKSFINNGTKSVVHSVNLELGFGISKNINANTSFGLVKSIMNDTTNNTTQIYSASLQHRALNNKLVSSITFSASQLQRNTSLRTTLSSGYSLTDKDRISLTFSLMHYKASDLNRNNFTEIITGLNISHRF